MNITDFKALLETYGANLARWPVAEQADARDFLEHSAEARDYYAGIKKVDDLFKQDTSQPPEDLVNRIVGKANNDE